MKVEQSRIYCKELLSAGCPSCCFDDMIQMVCQFFFLKTIHNSWRLKQKKAPLLNTSCGFTSSVPVELEMQLFEQRARAKSQYGALWPIKAFSKQVFAHNLIESIFGAHLYNDTRKESHIESNNF